MFQKRKKKDQDQAKETLINSFWDEDFLNLLLSQVKLRQFDYKGLISEVKRKQNFKKE